MRRRGRLVKPTGDRTNGQDADALIEEIAQDRGRPVSEEEMALILEHVASASFDPDKRRVKPALRGVSYRGYEIGEREPSLISHLAQRVVVDQQWAESTTTAPPRVTPRPEWPWASRQGVLRSSTSSLRTKYPSKDVGRKRCPCCLCYIAQ